MFIGARCGGSGISANTINKKASSEKLVIEKGQRKMGRFDQANRKATCSSNSCLQQWCVEGHVKRTTCQTMKPLQSRRCTWSHSCQQITGCWGYSGHVINKTEWLKIVKSVAWSEESQLLQQDADGRVEIWCKQRYKSMDPYRPVPMVQAGAFGVLVWCMCFRHTLGSWYELSIIWMPQHN